MNTHERLLLLEQKQERMQDAIISLDKGVQRLLVELKRKELNNKTNKYAEELSRFLNLMGFETGVNEGKLTAVKNGVSS